MFRMVTKVNGRITEARTNLTEAQVESVRQVARTTTRPGDTLDIKVQRIS